MDIRAQQTLFVLITAVVIAAIMLWGWLEREHPYLLGFIVLAGAGAAVWFMWGR